MNAFEFEESRKNLADYIAIIKRRRKLFLLPAVATLAIAVIAALLWPPTYRSTATILIEEQEVPRELVQSTITTFANQQIQIITQRIMTMNNIFDIVQKHGVYDADELRRIPRTEIALDFQENVNLDLVSAEVIDPRSGRPTQATIAFTLGFDHRDPAVAQKVANELVTLYLNENLRQRTQQSSSTSQFLRAESRQMKERIQELETQLARFKEENKGALPELYQYNLSLIDRLDREIADNKLRSKELAKSRLELTSRLAQLNRYAPATLPSGEQVLGDYDRLRSLRSEYSRKSAVYSENHPDVIRLSREIASLESILGGSISAEDHVRALQTAQDQLSELRNRYTADHPEVTAQERLVEQLRAQPVGENSNHPAPDNPAYVMLNTQLESTISEINFLQDKLVELQGRQAEVEAAIMKAPNVEKQYNQMVLDLQNTVAKYQEITAKQMSAELSQSLEQERKGQRFTLIDPPIRAQEPVSPNRLALMLVGIILAGGVGIGCVALAESLDNSVRSGATLAEITGAEPLVQIPYWKVQTEYRKDQNLKRWLLGGSAAGVVMMIVVFHFAIKPLDVAWFMLINRLGLS